MPSPIKHLTPAAYRLMPWKNGGGSTTEIAREPAEGDGFTWRVSMADLIDSGPFSAFPGVDRIITPLAGPAFRLSHGVHGTHEVTPLVPYAFSGDWATTATLGAPGRDYNVMVRRGVATAWTEVLGGGRGSVRTYRNGKVVLTALAAGSVEIAGIPYALEAYETLLADAPGRVSYASAGPFIVSAIKT